MPNKQNVAKSGHTRRVRLLPDFSAGLQTVDFLDSLTRFGFGAAVEISEAEDLGLGLEWLARFGDSEVERDRLLEFWIEKQSINDAQWPYIKEQLLHNPCPTYKMNG